MKEVGGGSDDLVLVLGRTQKTVKTFLKKCFAGSNGWFSWPLTLSIFLHAGVHTPVSVLLFEKGWFIQKRFFWMLSTGQILMF